MTENVPSELKHWFLRLGFHDKNLSKNEIEEEFRRLCPPEMRDIWRNVMAHLVPAKEVRFIEKILLLNELQKASAKNNHKIRINKTVTTVRAFVQHRKTQDNVKKLTQNRKSINETIIEIEKLKLAFLEKEKKRQVLKHEVDNLCNKKIAIELQTLKREKNIKNLFDVHIRVEHVNSLLHAKNTQQNEVAEDCVKSFVNLVSKFIEKENVEGSGDSAEHCLEELSAELIKLTADIPVTNLCKSVISSLGDTLKTLLALGHHLSVKRETQNTWLYETKLNELRKQCINLHINMKESAAQVNKLKEQVDHKSAEIIQALNNSNNVKENEFWLESECEKHRMVTKESFLNKEYQGMKNKWKELPNLENEKTREKIFLGIHDWNDQLAALERAIAIYMGHLSDNPLNEYIRCQNECVDNLKNSIKEYNFDEGVNATNTVSDNSIIEKIQNRLETRDMSKNTSVLELENLIPDEFVIMCAEDSIFFHYLRESYNNYSAEISQSSNSLETLKSKKFYIQKEETEFLNKLTRSLRSTRMNLKEVAKYSDECSNNLRLWMELSTNDIIPDGMMVQERSFKDWLKRYVTAIHCLRKLNMQKKSVGVC